jgi:acyl-CoA synthetase (AMP-forming)/AMP-acid ligase II
MRAEQQPHGVCLIEAETEDRITYRELRDDSLRLAARIRALGVGPGSTVATMLPHSIDTYRVWFALGCSADRLGSAVAFARPLLSVVRAAQNTGRVGRLSPSPEIVT